MPWSGQQRFAVARHADRHALGRELCWFKLAINYYITILLYYYTTILLYYYSILLYLPELLAGFCDIQYDHWLRVGFVKHGQKISNNRTFYQTLSILLPGLVVPLESNLASLGTEAADLGSFVLDNSSNTTGTSWLAGSRPSSPRHAPLPARPSFS